MKVLRPAPFASCFAPQRLAESCYRVLHWIDMTFTATKDIVTISQARVRLTELADDVSKSGQEKVFTRNGASCVALIAAGQLDDSRRLREAEHLSMLRALDALLDDYDSVRHLHPDAGSRALLLIDVVERELPQWLAAQPGIGRAAQLRVTQNQSERNWLARLAPLTARRRLQAREWLVSDFWVLYYRTSSAVYLASARHVREAAYR